MGLHLTGSTTPLPYFLSPSGGDDSAALTAALATGRQVRLVGTTFLVASDITPPAGAHVQGNGKNMTTVKVTGTGRGFLVQNTPNVTIRDLTVDCNKASTTDGGTTSGQQGIYVYASNSTGCTGIKLDNVRVKNSWYRGIVANADAVTTNPLDVEIVNCESYDNGSNALGTGANGIRVTNATRAVVRNNYVARNGGYGIHVLGCLSASVDDNYVDNHQNNHGIVVNNGCVDVSVCRNKAFRAQRIDYPIGSGAATFNGTTDTVATPAAHRMPVNTPVRFDTVTGTTGIVAGTIYYVKSVPSPTTFTVAATTVVGAPTIDLVGDGTGTGLIRPSSGQTQWGIVVGIDAAKMVVTDNIADGNEGGITIDVAELDQSVFVNTLGTVANNICINSTRANAGLNVNHADGLTITGNTVAYNTQQGISITGRNCTVVGNSSHHNQRRGIEFLESGDGCGPHYYGPNNIYSNNQVGGSWTNYYTDTLTSGAVVDATTVAIAAPQINDYAASATWTKPTGAVRVRVVCIGAGGGGGSGRRGAAATVRCGGGGGSGGLVASADFLASQLGATEAVTVGAGGAGGAAVTVDSTDGNAGGAGTVSSFGLSTNRWLVATAGAGGSGGTATAGGGGAATAPGGSSGISASTTGGVGVTANGATGRGTQITAGGGASAGGLTTGNAESAGGSGSLGISGSSTAAVAGTAAGGAGAAGNDSRLPATGGGGGAGGGSGAAVAGGAGGAGGLYGAGGGGGGATVNGNSSGKGGDGAVGFVRVITYFA